MNNPPSILFIGGGVMAEAIIAGTVRGGMEANRIVVEPVTARMQYLVAQYGVETLTSAQDVSPNIVVLAVKPQHFDEAASWLFDDEPAPFQIPPKYPDATIVSVMAGIPISRLQDRLRTDRIIRVMPNTPARIGKGVCAWTATQAVPPAAKDYVRQVLDCIGTQVYFDDEKLIDIATAVSASGPAYAFVFMEALTDAAVQLGMAHADAKRLAIGMVRGSAELAEAENDQHLAELRNSVTSPAGTTAAALKALEAGNFRNTVINAVVAAHRRGEQLARAE